MKEYVHNIATNNANQGRGQIDLRNASSQTKEVADAACAAALANQNKK